MLKGEIHRQDVGEYELLRAVWAVKTGDRSKSPAGCWRIMCLKMFAGVLKGRVVKRRYALVLDGERQEICTVRMLASMLPIQMGNGLGALPSLDLRT